MTFDREQGKLYQDQLYGTKVLTPLAVAIMDTPEFQRLSGFRQLGFADSGYRGAVHTRFSHSVGTYFLTRSIMRRIVQNHERLQLPHPGRHLSNQFQSVPNDAYPDGTDMSAVAISHQSLWRGLIEVVSIAALLHDIGHVPFGHTLEDEFAGIFKRHDRLAGPRLYEMLFNDQSDLARVFTQRPTPWVGNISNQNLSRLIYVILNWKENIALECGFQELIEHAIQKNGPPDAASGRMQNLKAWHAEFTVERLFHPFMSDIIGNTICADLLDYLPRDRCNLGMGYRFHSRLHKFLTIRPGTLYKDEGLRVSIMVTRAGHGGQRRDVATAVLDIMRERYEMAERVYYHHKKCALSTMLAKLTELTGFATTADNDQIYPAPWTEAADAPLAPRHLVHFSDSGLIDYLGTCPVESGYKRLQRQLYLGLRYRRSDIYRTLLVIDIDTARSSKQSLGQLLADMRGRPDMPSNASRVAVEKHLAEAGGLPEGSVLVYCAPPDMQAKEVDARLEIVEEKVLPLRLQRESFAYHADIAVLEQYYRELWRAYVFIAPAHFSNASACKAIVDALCRRYDIPQSLAYQKVRGHRFDMRERTSDGRRAELIQKFLQELPCASIPSEVAGAFFATAMCDERYTALVLGARDVGQRLMQLFDASVLQCAQQDGQPLYEHKNRTAHGLSRYIDGLITDTVSSDFSRNRQSSPWKSFDEYEKALIDRVHGFEIEDVFALDADETAEESPNS